MDRANPDNDARISAIIGGLDKIPTPSEVFFELARLMKSPRSTTNDVATVVGRDPGTAAKLLQLVNSAYFGTGKRVSSIQESVALLGLERLRYIMLTSAVFSTSEEDPRSGLSYRMLQERAMQAAVFASTFATGATRDEAFASALLHDLGHIILSLALPDAYRIFARRAETESSDALELELFGVRHADLGARLLAMWGLPATIIEAVRFHRDPGSAPPEHRMLASIVHAASAATRAPGERRVIAESLERAGTAALVEGWLAAR